MDNSNHSRGGRKTKFSQLLSVRQTDHHDCGIKLIRAAEVVTGRRVFSDPEKSQSELDHDTPPQQRL